MNHLRLFNNRQLNGFFGIEIDENIKKLKLIYAMKPKELFTTFRHIPQSNKKIKVLRLKEHLRHKSESKPEFLLIDSDWLSF